MPRLRVWLVVLVIAGGAVSFTIGHRADGSEPGVAATDEFSAVDSPHERLAIVADRPGVPAKILLPGVCGLAFGAAARVATAPMTTASARREPRRYRCWPPGIGRRGPPLLMAVC